MFAMTDEERTQRIGELLAELMELSDGKRNSTSSLKMPKKHWQMLHRD
jgi:ribosomal protein L29